jgi:hypothetical protein
MSSLEEFALERISEEEASKAAEIICAIANTVATGREEYLNEVIERLSNAAHNATLIEDALKAELKKMEER